MKTRHLLALAAALPLVAAVTPADAAAAAAKRRPRPPAKVCNLIKDSTGDATGNGSIKTPNDPNLDIVTADIATNATTITGVIRLVTLDGSENSSQTGRAYAISFLAHNKVVTLRALVSPAGNDFFEGKGTGSVDTGKKEVRIHVPLTALPVPLKKGDTLKELKATTARWVGTVPLSLGIADTAVGAGTYTLHTASCVAVGV